jgi:hypothetical protein
MFKSSYLSTLCAKALGLLLILASFSKITDLAAFKTYLDSIDLLPTVISNLLLLLLPSAELVVGMGLLTKYAYSQIRVIAIVLFGGFFVFSILSFLGSAPPCHCFQSQGLERLFNSGIVLVIRNMVFFLMSVMAFQDIWVPEISRK